MPPRYAYWTIIVDNQPTAFRAGAKEDLLPTFNRLKAKNDTAVMMWFQNGKLWPSRLDAQEAMLARGEMGRRGDSRQAGGFRDRDRRPTRFEKPAWKPKTSRPQDRTAGPQDLKTSRPSEKLDWKPKGEFTPAPKRSGFAAEGRESRRSSSSSEGGKPKGSFDRDRKPAWKPKGFEDGKPRSFGRPDWKPRADDTRSAKPEWKPKGSFDRKTEWKPKGSFDRKTEWKPKASFDRKTEWKPKASFTRERKPDWKPRTSRPQDLKTSRPEKLDWKPRTDAGSRKPEAGSPSEKRKWVPKAEYKKSLGIEAKRDDKWRPGGEHRDPKQKYKDAKKAKWSKFKKNIRQNWEKKAGKKKGE